MEWTVSIQKLYFIYFSANFCYSDRIPIIDAEGRVIGILAGRPDDLVVTSSWTVPDGELVERFSRSSGPGGQGVNTADSRVELSFDVAGSRSLPSELRDRVMSRLAATSRDQS